MPVRLRSSKLIWQRGREWDPSLHQYNSIGQTIRSWDFSNLPMGYHSVLWDGQDQDGRPVGSGVYFIRMRAENFVQVRKATLLR